MHLIQSGPVEITQAQFEKSLCDNTLFRKKPEALQGYVRGNVPRLYRIFRNMLLTPAGFQGPTLDVGSGWGIMYPVYKGHFPAMMPCHVAELFCYGIDDDGVRIPCVRFECERGEIPYEDETFGTVVFCDVLEHLIVDPVYTLLELNRVLKTGGRLILSTPNALAAYRVLKIFHGHTPATESELRPGSIYQRHNREYTPDEVSALMTCCGFGNTLFTTSPDHITGDEDEMIRFAGEKGLLGKPREYFGPELFCVGDKLEHRTVSMDLPMEERWPEWLYTGSEIYRRRPRVFPINAENPEMELMRDWGEPEQDQAPPGRGRGGILSRLGFGRRRS